MNSRSWLLLGTAAGATVALLFTPTASKALQATGQAKSYIDLQKLHSEWRAQVTVSPRSVWREIDIAEQPMPQASGAAYDSVLTIV